MSVKNIVRNLFLSGALVLSGGVVCSRQVFAIDEEAVQEFVRKYAQEAKQLIKEGYDVMSEGLNCWQNYANCLEEVISNPKLDINNCKAQRDKCLDKVTRRIESMEQEWSGPEWPKKR